MINKTIFASYRWNPNLIVSLACISVMIIFIMLAIWQVNRAMVKEQELLIIDGERKNPYTTMSELQVVEDNKPREPSLYFHTVNIRGSFLAKTFLLDNSIYKDMLVVDKKKQTDNPYCYLFSTCGKKLGVSKVGYRIFGLFMPEGELELLLVERGWQGGFIERDKLPFIKVPQGLVNLQGVIMPDAGRRKVLKADILDRDAPQQLVQKVAAAEYQKVLGLDIYSHPVILAANSPGALEVFAPLANFSYLSAARHYGYAFQWFLMSITLLILYIMVSLKKQNK